MFAERAICVAKQLTVVILFAGLTGAQQQPQPMSKFDRDRALGMLTVIGNDIKKHYYDPSFHGVNWDAKVEETKGKIQAATSFNMAMSLIAAMLDTLNDSHTFLLPPQHAYHHDYGFQYQMVGEHCFVNRVRPKSDAEAKGVKPGDELLAINGFKIDRDSLWKLQYVFSVLRPQGGLRLGLQDPSGAQRQVDVAAKIRETKRVTDLTGEGSASDVWDLIRQSETDEHLMRARYFEVGDQLLVLKVPE